MHKEEVMGKIKTRMKRPPSTYREQRQFRISAISSHAILLLALLLTTTDRTGKHPFLVLISICPLLGALAYLQSRVLCMVTDFVGFNWHFTWRSNPGLEHTLWRLTVQVNSHE